jgi:hypothetical protein
MAYQTISPANRSSQNPPGSSVGKVNDALTSLVRGTFFSHVNRSICSDSKHYLSFRLSPYAFQHEMSLARIREG